MDGRNDLRKITVRPSSRASVVLVLPTTSDCAAEGADLYQCWQASVLPSGVNRAGS